MKKSAITSRTTQQQHKAWHYHRAKSLFVFCPPIRIIVASMLGFILSIIDVSDHQQPFQQVSAVHSTQLPSDPTKYTAKPSFHEYCVLVILLMVDWGLFMIFYIWDCQTSLSCYAPLVTFKECMLIHGRLAIAALLSVPFLKALSVCVDATMVCKRLRQVETHLAVLPFHLPFDSPCHLARHLSASLSLASLRMSSFTQSFSCLWFAQEFCLRSQKASCLSFANKSNSGTLARTSAAHIKTLSYGEMILSAIPFCVEVSFLKVAWLYSKAELIL